MRFDVLVHIHKAKMILSPKDFNINNPGCNPGIHNA